MIYCKRLKITFILLLSLLTIACIWQKMSHFAFAVVQRRQMSSFPGGSGENILYAVLCGGAFVGTLSYVSSPSAVEQQHNVETISIKSYRIGLNDAWEVSGFFLGWGAVEMFYASSCLGRLSTRCPVTTPGSTIAFRNLRPDQRRSGCLNRGHQRVSVQRWSNQWRENITYSLQKDNRLHQGCPNYGSRASCGPATDCNWSAACL